MLDFSYHNCGFIEYDSCEKFQHGGQHGCEEQRKAYVRPRDPAYGME